MGSSSRSKTSESLFAVGVANSAVAVLAVLVKGVFFSRKVLVKMGYNRSSARRCLLRLRNAGVIEKTPEGVYVLGRKSFEKLSKVSSLDDLEWIAQFAYDLFGMKAWNEEKVGSAADRLAAALRTIKRGEAVLSR